MPIRVPIVGLCLMAGEIAAETRGISNGEAAAATGVKPVGGACALEKLNRRGRPKGSMNKTTRLAKEAISEAEPHQFLIRVMEGRKFRRAGTEGARKTTDCYPTLHESISAAELLLRKIVPDLKSQELTGDPDKPIGLVNGESMSNFETARRIALIFGRAGFVLNTDQARGAADLQAVISDAGGPADGSNGFLGPDTPAGEKAASESGEATDSTSGPEPPSKGKSLWFDRLEVRNVGPCREGLPSMYVVHRGEKEIKRGSWGASLAQVRKLIGKPLPPGRLAETRPDGALPRPSPREQRSSGPRCF